MGAAQPGDGGSGDSQADRPSEKLQPPQQPDQAVTPSDVGKGLFAVRPAKQDDLGLIFETWIWGYYDGNPWLKEHISRDHFWQFYRNVLQGLFDLPGTGVLILCLSADPDTIIGYLVGAAPNVLHWVFIKKHFQGHGLSKSLAAQAGIVRQGHTVVTHLTDTARKKLPPAWEFKPYLLY